MAETLCETDALDVIVDEVVLDPLLVIVTTADSVRLIDFDCESVVDSDVVADMM